MILLGGLAVACAITLCEKLLSQLKRMIVRRTSSSFPEHSSKDHVAIKVKC